LSLIVIFVEIGILTVREGNIIKNIENPDYHLIASKKDIEIRDYAPMIVAEVEVSGERQRAIREGFTMLADYIFGNNISDKNIGMAAKVTHEESEKIAMTAPVMQQQHRDKWKIRFMMPKKYSLKTLPKPKSKDVVLIALPAQRYAVLRFSGLPDDDNIKQHLEELQAYISAETWKVRGGPILAFYNPPWTLPFLRRNEVMVEIEVD